MLGYAMVFPLLPIYAVRLDADAFTIGLMVASFSVAQFAASPLWGRLSDRFGRCPALMVSSSPESWEASLPGITEVTLLYYRVRFGDEVLSREEQAHMQRLCAAIRLAALGDASGSSSPRHFSRMRNPRAFVRVLWCTIATMAVVPHWRYPVVGRGRGSDADTRVRARRAVRAMASWNPSLPLPPRWPISSLWSMARIRG